MVLRLHISSWLEIIHKAKKKKIEHRILIVLFYKKNVFHSFKLRKYDSYSTM